LALGARADQTIIDREHERQVRATVAELERQMRKPNERFLRQMAAEEPVRLREIPTATRKSPPTSVSMELPSRGGALPGASCGLEPRASGDRPPTEPQRQIGDDDAEVPVARQQPPPGRVEDLGRRSRRVDEPVDQELRPPIDRPVALAEILDELVRGPWR